MIRNKNFINMSVEDMTFSIPQPELIQGFPELRWAGKRPFTSTRYYPSQCKERYGNPVDGWMNRIYWGDNLQVMSHLLKEFRGKIDLVYIDPPFDSKAEYKKTITLHGTIADSNSTVFEEKQYTDIWINDKYLQFVYERLILLKELLSDTGSIYVHCDWHKSSFLRILLDEIFGTYNFRNEIVWSYFGFKRKTSKKFPQKHDLIFSYTKSKNYTWNVQYRAHTSNYIARFKKDENGRLYRDDVNPTGGGSRVIYLDDVEGDIIDSVWDDIPPVNPVAKERQNYPTQKPEALLERIIKSSSNPGDLVFDCFMGSGTTQAVAMKLGRRFIGTDINLGAIQTTTKRLNNIIQATPASQLKLYLNFEVYNVNNYDVFRNPVQAREVLLQALEIEPLASNDIFDGMKDDYKVKIMPINRIATRADLNPLLNGRNYRELDRQIELSPCKPAERIMLVCMGHEPDLAANLKMDIGLQYMVDVKVVDILRDQNNLTFTYDSEADIIVENGELVIRQFYPRNLLQKLSILEENVENWRHLVETVAIDWNYNGNVLQPALYDNPGKNELVQGRYTVPHDYGIIRVKITDLLSESLEMTLEVK